MYGDLKLAFINKALTDYMQSVIKRMKSVIIKKDVRFTDELLKSFHFNVFQSNADGNANLNFAEWGRMIDMGVGRGHPLGGIKATSELIDKAKQRKPVKIYSPIAYGQLNGLIGDLMYGFTEETKSILKKELENGNRQPN